MQYFSDTEGIELPRDNHEISRDAWGGISALISQRVTDGSFGDAYRKICQDGNAIIGTDTETFRLAIHGEISGMAHIPWDFEMYETQPTTIQILDLIVFCWNHISDPNNYYWHKHFRHWDLQFDKESGQERFKDDIERIFRRNGIAYNFTYDGKIERIAPPFLHEELAKSDFDTGNPELDRLLNSAKRKFLDPDLETRGESLEALWGAWERLKTIDIKDKKAGIKALLDGAAGPSSVTFRCALERESKELTNIGNSLGIRHSETNQEKLVRSEHIDYSFHRMFSLIHLILRMRK